MNRLIYLDNAATTQVYPQVLDAMLPFFTEHYGNPSAIYSFANEAKKAVDQSRSTIADLIGANTDEIYFTGGGSESDNWALVATAEAYESKGKHIITSKIEHHAILHTCEYLEKRGYEITYIDVDEKGTIKLDELEAAIRPDTILISVMAANNEIGTIQPLKEIGAIAKAHGVLFHTDAVQAFAHIPINVDEMNIDMLSASGHKIHGPKGIGFLYINEKVKIIPQILGGGQQSGMRSGTDNVPGIAGLGVAAAQIYENLDENVEHMYQLKEHIAEGLSEIEDIRINGMPLREGAPQILSISVMGVRSEVLLHALEDKEIYISAGSACSSHKRKPSATLSAMGMSKDQIESTVRLSFCEENTMEEADYFLQTMKELVPMLRRYSRK